MLPFTAASEALLGPGFVAADLKELDVILERTEPQVQSQWAGFILEAKAVVAPQAAWDGLLDLYAQRQEPLDPGTSLSAMLHWVATRRQAISGGGETESSGQVAGGKVSA
mmetsp:Transcript_69769/g.157680  ORF Transcript_69769/g.157680 Transcript_69769/m.157680 type:complete len:110 (-) Transcript_69769:150-479(-)